MTNIVAKKRRVMLATALTCFSWALELPISERALACACCAELGERNVGPVKYDSYRQETIRPLRFDHTADLVLGAAGFDGVKGIITPSDESYEFQVFQRPTGITFSFQGNANHSGTLFLKWPNSISICGFRGLRTGVPIDCGH
jgi:hypothetical protein